MFVERSVLVGGDLAELVAKAVADHIRADQTRDSDKVRRLLADLGILAAARPTSGRDVDGDTRPWLSTAEASPKLHRSERSIRRDAKAGRIEARKVGGRWQVRI